MNIKRLLSYFIPINIHQKESKINNNLEITWNNGKLVLDSKNTNFSYGSLQKVLRKGLQEIGFEQVKSFKNIAILGVAGGSVIKTLVEELQFEGQITGVEIDPATIQLANDYFGLHLISNLKIVIDDAEQFVKTTNQNFDLIIIDIFQDSAMPDFLFQESFLKNVLNILNPKGNVLFNTIISGKRAEERNDNFIKFLDPSKIDIKRLSKIEGNNELIILRKL